MIAIKGFNANLSCTMGQGTYHYEIGKTYTEEVAKCGGAGFHAVEEPIDVLNWYSGSGSRHCIVDASGDIHEVGDGRIACTQITIIKEISLVQLGMLECRWIQTHPARQYSNRVHRDKGDTSAENDIIIVRGKHPKAAGGMNTVLFLCREAKKGREIEEIAVYQIDGKTYLPDVYYRTDGRAAECAKTC